MTRTIPKLKIVSPSGGDDIDTATEAYADWPEIEEPCLSIKAPAGQCQYGPPDDSVCMYCGKASGVE